MKVLNLDSFEGKEKRKLKVRGIEYEVLDMTVGNFIETTKAAESVANGTTAEQIEATIGMICRSVPTLPVDALNGLNLEQLQAIVGFIRGDQIEGVEEAEGGEGK